MKILVVDDDPVTLAVVRQELESNGHSLTTADDGYKALCLLEEQRYDIVICDVFMPQLSGLVLANIISHYYGQTVPLLLMSSNKNVGLFVRAQVNLIYDFIDKPVSLKELVMKVETLGTLKQVS